jgi:hypothetical protein
MATQRVEFGYNPPTGDRVDYVVALRASGVKVVLP